MKTIFKHMNRLALVALTTAGLAGCNDVLTGIESPVPQQNPTQVGKMRQAHLFQAPGAGKVIERYAELAAATDFVVGLNPVVLDMNRVIDRYAAEPGVTITRSYKRVYKGFAMHVDSDRVPGLIEKIENDPDVVWMEPDIKVKQPRPSSSGFKGGNNEVLPWGIDRIEADLSSTRAGDGEGSVDVDLYVLDSGVKGHDVSLVEEMSFVPGEEAKGDAVGHGTHVAGTAAARDNSYGVVGAAPGARVHSFKVLNNGGNGDISAVIAAIELITERKAADPSAPIVVNMSFGGDIGTSAYNALDEAIKASIGQGVVYVIAAGNAATNASTVTPAHVVEAITVGAYDVNNAFAGFSNFGSVVDILAPGVDVVSTSNATGAKKPPVKMSGTSMAAPHVAGAAALYLSKNPGATPAAVRTALVNAGKATVTGVPAGTTNKTVHMAGF